MFTLNKYPVNEVNVYLELFLGGSRSKVMQECNDLKQTKDP